jgi:hypothetical protein
VNVSGSVVGRFPIPSSGLGLSIEPDLEPNADDAIHLLLFPTDSDIRVHASVGEVTRGDVKSVRVPSGFVTFSGGTTASFPHAPFQSAIEFSVQYSLDAEGNGTSIGLSYNAATNILTASEEVYAGVAYKSYMAAARRLSYRPYRRNLAVGFELEFGVISAVKPSSPPVVVVYPVSPFEVFNGNAVYELYKITSKTLSTPAGEHEMTNNLPANPGTYTGSAETLDTSVFMENKRVHEIGYMDASGRGWPYVIFHANLFPFVGDNNYTPTKTVEIAPITQFPENLRLKALAYIASQGLGRA